MGDAASGMGHSWARKSFSPKKIKVKTKIKVKVKGKSRVKGSGRGRRLYTGDQFDFLISTDLRARG